MKFVPERLEVAAGDRITWVNRDFVPHTVTAKGAGIESGDLGEGKSFSYLAKRTGEIPYICRLHPVMKGIVVVK
jgi:plastocyanin